MERSSVRCLVMMLAMLVVLGGGACGAFAIELWLTDFTGDDVHRFSWPSGQHLGTIDCSSNGPQCLTYGPDGHVYLSDFWNDRVLRIDHKGTLIDEFITEQDGLPYHPLGSGFGPDGCFYVTSFWTHSVLRYSATGEFESEFVAPASGGLRSPCCLTWGNDGNMYVSSEGTDQIKRYDGQTGAYIDDFVPAGEYGPDSPHALLFGADGDLYVASMDTDSVRRYDAHSGAYLDDFVAPGRGGLDMPVGMAFGPDGNLYVASWGTDEVLRYDGQSGAFLDAFVGGQVSLGNSTYLVFVPEPSTFLLLCAGAVAAFGTRRVRQCVKGAGPLTPSSVRTSKTP